MNERIRELAIEANMIASEPNGFDPTGLTKSQQKFAELIVRDCLAINKVETTALDLPEYNLGMLEGYRRVRENMSIHFGVEE